MSSRFRVRRLVTWAGHGHGQHLVMDQTRWPDDWDERRRGRGCPKCILGRPEEDESGGVRFFAGDFADGYLQKRAPLPGYAIVAFHRRHVADLTEFTQEESAGFWRDVVAVARALDKVFRPCHLSYNVLGNGVPHVHAHVVPRYLDDPCPGMPLSPWVVRNFDVNVFTDQLGLLRSVV